MQEIWNEENKTNILKKRINKMSNLYEVSDTKKMINLIAKIRLNELDEPTTKSLRAKYHGNKTWSLNSFTEEDGLQDLTENEMNCFKSLCYKDGIRYQS